MDDLIAGVNHSDRTAMQRGIGEMDNLLNGISLSQANVGTDLNVVEQQNQVIDDTKLTLNAFIVSGTQFSSLLNVSCEQADLEDRNVLFMNDGGPVYLKKMFERIIPFNSF